jgi:ferredoxin-thioredoxin reductase catalytic subunit
MTIMKNKGMVGVDEKGERLYIFQCPQCNDIRIEKEEKFKDMNILCPCYVLNDELRMVGTDPEYHIRTTRVMHKD